MTHVFCSRDEFNAHVLETALKVHQTLQGSRNDVALSAVLVTAGAALEKFGTQQPESTPTNVLLLIALIRDVTGDIADYAVTPRARES